MNLKIVAAGLGVLLATVAVAQDVPFKTGKFPQEIATRYPTAASGESLANIETIHIVDGNVVASGPELSVYFDGAAFAATAPEKPGRESEPALTDIEDGLGRVWKAEQAQAAATDSEGNLWVGFQAGVAQQTPDGWRFHEGKDGLPYTSFTCAAAGPNGDVWFGTKKGVVRWSDGSWHYRQGMRWLPDDEIRAIAVDSEGGAWVATPGGIGRIHFQMMTLREKAEYYEKELELIRRTPFGYVSEVSVTKPGDKSEIHHHDSDNDGLWTSMYGAGVAFAYGATKDPIYKERADRAFEALRFLQKVTQGGEHVPPHGYVARTILPTSGPNPNDGRIERDIEEAKTDALWKVYENRWPVSADGQWYWKSDTSSDELDGHYFFYPAYYDLCAETEDEKERVREVVRDLTDHLVKHGFRLVDHDGKPTRWAIYDPESLNHSQAWWSERGLKSLSMLSYLAVAAHITGDDKYNGEIDKLVREHAYHTNALVAKIQFGPGSGNQSDDEMAIMCYYNLVKYAKDETLRDLMRYGFYQYYAIVEPELNPFFNFAYAAVGRGETLDNIWGSFPIDPQPTWLEYSMDTLFGFPLDRFNWAHQNSHRLDIVPLRWQQTGKDLYEPIPRERGHRVNGKVLPVENRFFNHWNTDPWALDYGGNGRGLASGTVFLLPYYMGLYHGFIEETE
ncbi:MAG: hypothetical protein RLZZ303_2704 [Candidatus Hydrogenedentota bacterium]|jgi:hypothetical protein